MLTYFLSWLGSFKNMLSYQSYLFFVTDLKLKMCNSYCSLSYHIKSEAMVPDCFVFQSDSLINSKISRRAS
jgi:hypothetical protein